MDLCVKKKNHEACVTYTADTGVEGNLKIQFFNHTTSVLFRCKLLKYIKKVKMFYLRYYYR
jgi:hypothetical protein